MTDDARRAVLAKALDDLAQQRFAKAVELRLVDAQIAEVNAALSEIHGEPTDG